MKARFRTLFISDSHLGSNGAQAEQLARFLKHVEADEVYLVGDIIDMWRLKQRWYWPDSHNTVLRRLLKMSHKGTRIIYVPGNHDDASRQFCGLVFGGIEVAMEAVHETADGRRLLVTHGDKFDLVVRHSRLLSVAGSVGYELLLAINKWYNRGRRLFGLPYDSLSQAIKLRVKRACNFISNFETALVRDAKEGGYDGVICGHIHKAEQREIDGVAYLNCGDWVESCTALAEHADGRIELIDGLTFLAARDAAKAMREGEGAGEGDDTTEEAVETEESDPWLAAPVALLRIAQ